MSDANSCLFEVIIISLLLYGHFTNTTIIFYSGLFLTGILICIGMIALLCYCNIRGIFKLFERIKNSYTHASKIKHLEYNWWPISMKFVIFSILIYTQLYVMAGLVFVSMLPLVYLKVKVNGIITEWNILNESTKSNTDNVL